MVREYILIMVSQRNQAETQFCIGDWPEETEL